MSRSATATPPLPYFPAKVATPSTRHASAPTASHAHFKHGHHSSKKARKHGFGSSGKTKHATSAVPKSEGLGLDMPLEDHSGFTVIENPATFGAPLTRQPSSTSVLTFHSAQSIPSIQTIDSADNSLAPTAPPSISNTTAESVLSLPLYTPESASVVSLPSLLQAEPEVPLSSANTPASAHRATWTSNFGKMAKAVVHTGKSMGIQFGGERKKRESGADSPAPIASAQLAPTAQLPQTPPTACTDCPLPTLIAVPRPSADELAQLDPQAALARKREWAEAENKRVLECARLCSQWPQSGYNQSKWGPNGQSPISGPAGLLAHACPGAKAFYEPQSYANPGWVAAVMKRQADLEHHLTSSAATYFTCRRERQSSSSDDGSDQSSDSYTSSQSSPTTSSQFEIEQRTIADIKAAMDSTIVEGPVPALRGTRSITELDALASSMALSSSSRDATAMDIDSIENVQDSPARTRHERAQSCGSKRRFNLVDAEEEKRRKVDEAMVVEEAVSSGVIMPSPMVDKTGQNRKLSSSTPDLSSVKQQNASAGPAVFGHVVKTSDTHPIIISPFFPSDLLSTLASNLVRPTGQTSPIMLASRVDVPSMLLAFAPSASATHSLPSSPIRPELNIDTRCRRLGNLLLSSCPGKRLRMEGPVKGRAPVCRDLETDLRRIKNEGVGCLVCCLDDAELALLGVPWETYRSIASKIGMDVIR